MKFTIAQVRAKLEKINLLKPDTGLELSYAHFKNMSSIHKYGRGRLQKKIVFCGKPKETLFAFYVMNDTDPIVQREAYDMYKRLVKGDMGPIEDGDVMIGNCGFPMTYGDIRWREPK